MFFLLRMAFWLGLVVLLLPLAFKGAGGENVSVFDALGAMQAVLKDARGFCDRQPDACAVGGQMVSHLSESAQTGAKWLADTLQAASAKAPDTASDATGAHGPASAAAGPQGLTQQDLEPRWGGESTPPSTAASPAPTAKQPG